MLSDYFSKKHIIIFLLLLGVIVFLGVSVGFQKALFSALESLDSYIRYHPILGMLVFVLFTVFSAMFVFFSTAAVVPVSVYVWGQQATFFLLISGWILGGIFAYLIGKYLGRKAVEKFISTRRINFYERKISREFNFAYMFLFRLVAPSEIPSYLLGIIRYNFFKYFLVTVMAEIPFAYGVVYASEIFLQKRFVWLAVFTVVAAAVFWFLRHKFHHLSRR